MGNGLREGWEVRKLGEICEISIGKTPPRSNKKFWDTEKVTKNIWLSIRDLNKSINKNVFDSREYLSNEGGNLFKKVPKGTLLVSFKLTLGRLAFAGTDLYTNEAIASLKILNDKKLNKEYLYHYLTFFDWDAATNGEVKVKGKTLNKAKLKELNIFIPPLQEQEKIVALLDEAFLAIEKAKTNAELNLQNAKELFESYLQGVFENNTSGSKYDSLDSICAIIVDCEHKTAPKQETGYPSIRTPNIGQGILLLDNVNRVSEEVYKEWTRRAIPQENDLILAREAPAGNIAVIPKNLKVCLGQRTVLIRPNHNKFISKYLAFLILSKDVQKQLLSHSQGATVTHINMKDIRAFRIYNLPSLQQQKDILNKIEKLLIQTKKLESIYTQKLLDLEELKKSILQKAFNGELI